MRHGELIALRASGRSSQTTGVLPKALFHRIHPIWAFSNNRSPPKSIIPPNPSYMGFLKRRARVALDFTMRSYWASRKKKSCRNMEPIVCSKLKFWSTHFVGLLMLMSGGQRPQVFTTSGPQQTRIRRVCDQQERKSYIELRTVGEKRPRHLDFPSLVLPAAILKYLEFHVEVIRPAILGTTRSILNGSYDPLLLHTRTGQGLKPSQVTTALQAFLCSHSFGLRGTTSMDLRGSCVNMTLRSYLQNQVFPDLSEAEFLQKIAQQMNTSVYYSV